jgi:hypothetical protein
MFTHTTLAALAEAAEDRILADAAAIPEQERERLLDQTAPSPESP